MRVESSGAQRRAAPAAATPETPISLSSLVPSSHQSRVLSEGKQTPTSSTPRLVGGSGPFEQLPTPRAAVRSFLAAAPSSKKAARASPAVDIYEAKKKVAPPAAGRKPPVPTRAALATSVAKSKPISKGTPQMSSSLRGTPSAAAATSAATSAAKASSTTITAETPYESYQEILAYQQKSRKAASPQPSPKKQKLGSVRNHVCLMNRTLSDWSCPFLIYQPPKSVSRTPAKSKESSLAAELAALDDFNSGVFDRNAEEDAEDTLYARVDRSVSTRRSLSGRDKSINHDDTNRQLEELSTRRTVAFMDQGESDILEDIDDAMRTRNITENISIRLPMSVPISPSINVRLPHLCLLSSLH